MQATAMDQGIGITNTTLVNTLGVLKQTISDEQVLLMKLRNCHWNVTGPNFRELHALFEEQYQLVARRIDEIAERIRALDAPAVGTMTEYLQRTALHEHPGSFPAAKEMLSDLLGDHEIIVRSIRDSLTLPPLSDLDVGTVDHLTGLMQDHEKMAWMLRATLSDKAAERQKRHSVLYE
ncbi:MAG: DNA starvation/stationary phase protection protein [Acidobacteriota bacterium]